MSRLMILFKRVPLITQPARHYAPYLSIIRPFSAASSPSTAAKPASSSSSSSSPSSSPSASTATSGPSPDSSVSSTLNVKPPKPRQMDIRQLSRLEEKAAGTDHIGVAPLSQQGGVEADEVPIDPGEAIDSRSRLTFTDLPLSEVLLGKQRYGSSVHSVAETDTITSAMELMKLYGIGAVLVRSASPPSDIVGIISTRDFVDKVSKGVHPTQASVRDFMTESPVFAFDDDNAIACLELMTRHNFRHLPVRERKSGKCIGLVSIGDLVRLMLKQYRETIGYYKDYIDGKYR